uniref:Uncharacterized protein n=1 Tax=Magallana gigas TaxID=29159 RepID=K1Q7F8_MAGGI|nr:uncharacterized protein LOC105347200 isoform X6 [Crassostrea gigas]|eukprot:XP_011454469.1 PREDICTED: uncharacterized protein LOC105347200 isoform X7 [Crassostrea gigas]
MAESAYHMEALRRQRVIDRKRAALDKMVNGGSQDTGPNVEQANAKNPILFSGPGDYDTNRNQIEDVLGENSQARKNKPLPKKQMPVKKPPPESIRNIKRNMVFKILHPYDFD